MANRADTSFRYVMVLIIRVGTQLSYKSPDPNPFAALSDRDPVFKSFSTT